MCPPQSPEVHDGDFRRSAEVRYPTNSIGNAHTYLPPRSSPLPMPSLNLWRAERVPRAMLTSTTSNGPCDQPLSYPDQRRVCRGSFGENWRTPSSFADLGLPGRSRGNRGPT
jgi:hypothetical protein